MNMHHVLMTNQISRFLSW